MKAIPAELRSTLEASSAAANRINNLLGGRRKKSGATQTGKKDEGQRSSSLLDGFDFTYRHLSDGENDKRNDKRNFGDLRGQPYDRLGFNPLTMSDAPPGGESAAEFDARVARAFAHIVALRAALPGSLAVVTHGLVIRALLANHLSSAESLPLKVGNTSVTIVAAHAPHGVELLDCTRHLVDNMQHKHGSLSGG
jgi:hypothetical protein